MIMHKALRLIALVFAFIALSLVTAEAQIDLKQAQVYEDEIARAVVQLKTLLLPFGAKAGFPNARPAGHEKASYEELYQAAATRSLEGSRFLTDMLKKMTFPLRIELSTRYFIKRLDIASHLYPEHKGNERVFEFLCRDFAAACDQGFEHVRFWGLPEMLVFDNIWFKNVQEGFIPVQKKMALAVLPPEIDPAQARDIWKQAANALVVAGNEAGIASTKVGCMGFAAFPAWRLKYSILYFKAAAKAAVVEHWQSRNSDTRYWLKACEQLRSDISRLNSEIDAFLAAMK